MRRDSGVIRLRTLYIHRCFSPPESKRMDSSRSFGEYYLRRHRAHMLPRCSRGYSQYRTLPSFVVHFGGSRQFTC